MTTPTITCDHCESEIDVAKDPRCVVYDPSGATDVICEACRERAYDKWIESALSDWPVSDTEKLRMAYRFKWGWSEMVERVRLALRKKKPTLSNPESEELARAAIEAMREPTMAMELAAQASDQRPSTIWGTMIDEALK